MFLQVCAGRSNASLRIELQEDSGFCYWWYSRIGSLSQWGSQSKQVVNASALPDALALIKRNGIDKHANYSVTFFPQSKIPKLQEGYGSIATMLFNEKSQQQEDEDDYL